ncbi:MAG TPA: acyl-CoA dehydrogenase family protein [Polyangiaceae bacterium]|jgi:alkylation response protein AidB-like acyl-CoA dehydrogenase
MASSPADVLRALLGGPAGPPIAPIAPVASIAGLRAHASRAPESTIDHAVLGGLASGSVGWAFACGYEAALARLDPAGAHGAVGVDAGALCAMCATEEGGGHPRAIRTTLADRGDGTFVLDGRKSWVTLGTDAQVLLVVASTGTDDRGRNRLRVVRIPAARAGVRLEPGGTAPFAPEIGHARAVFEGVRVDPAEVLAGDGYDAFLKPFRTIEDAHVMAAVLAWGVGVAHVASWDRAWTEEALAVLLAWRSLGEAPPSEPATHVAVAGALATTKRLLDAGAWDRTDERTRLGWERDRALLGVASTVRAARLEAAWRALTTQEAR